MKKKDRRKKKEIQKNSFVVVWLFLWLLFSLTNTCWGGGFSSSEGVESIGGQSGVRRRIFSICKWCVPERACSFRVVEDNGACLKLIWSFSIIYSFYIYRRKILFSFFIFIFKDLTTDRNSISSNLRIKTNDDLSEKQTLLS